MEYVPDVELFCDPLMGPSVPTGDLNQLAQSSPVVPTEGLGPALAACARVGFPGCASKYACQATQMTARTLRGFSTVPLALLKSRSSVQPMQMLLLQKEPVTSSCVTENSMPGWIRQQGAVGHRMEKVDCVAWRCWVGSGPEVLMLLYKCHKFYFWLFILVPCSCLLFKAESIVNVCKHIQVWVCIWKVLFSKCTLLPSGRNGKIPQTQISGFDALGVQTFFGLFLIQDIVPLVAVRPLPMWRASKIEAINQCLPCGSWHTLRICIIKSRYQKTCLFWPDSKA